jgi:hypothetical protein
VKNSSKWMLLAVAGVAVGVLVWRSRRPEVLPGSDEHSLTPLWATWKSGYIAAWEDRGSNLPFGSTPNPLSGGKHKGVWQEGYQLGWIDRDSGNQFGYAKNPYEERPSR